MPATLEPHATTEGMTSGWSEPESPTPAEVVITAPPLEPASQTRRVDPAAKTETPSDTAGMTSLADLFRDKEADIALAAERMPGDVEDPDAKKDKNRDEKEGKKPEASKPADAKPKEDKPAAKGESPKEEKKPAPTEAPKVDVLALPKPKDKDEYRAQFIARGNAVREERKRAEALERDLATAREAAGKAATANPVPPPDYEELKTRAARLAEIEPEFEQTRSRLYRLRLEERPEFRRAVTEPTRVMQENIATIAKRNGFNEGEFYDALNTADPEARRGALDDLLGGITSETDKRAFLDVVQYAPRVAAVRQEFEADAKRQLDAYEAQEKQRAEGETTKQRQGVKAAAHAYRAQVYKEFPFLLKVEGEGEETEKLNAALEQARKDKDVIHDRGLDSFPREFQGRVVEDAVEAPLLRRMNAEKARLLTERDERIKALESELDDLKGGHISDEGGGFTPDDDEDGLAGAASIATLFKKNGFR